MLDRLAVGGASAMGDVLGPLIDVLEPVKVALFGETTYFELIAHWVPLALTVILPLICLPFVALGICGGLLDEDDDDAPKLAAKNYKFGKRFVLTTIRAALRAGKDARLAKLHRVYMPGTSMPLPLTDTDRFGRPLNPPSKRDLPGSPPRSQRTGVSRFY